MPFGPSTVTGLLAPLSTKLKKLAIVHTSTMEMTTMDMMEVDEPLLSRARDDARAARGCASLRAWGRKRFVLSADDDNDLRSRCE